MSAKKKQHDGDLLEPQSPLEEKGDEVEVEPASCDDTFFIVGMGGSAGALEAFEQFFHVLPEDTGLAYVLVPHLDPTHKGIMPELLQRLTPMQVFQAQDGMQVQPNCVYVIPPNKDMGILHGKLQLLEPSAPRGLRLPIDFFFRHLAEDQKEHSIAIILSGMGTDGTLGLKAIKEHMGMALVQDPKTAKYDSMPRSAVETGLVDYIAPIGELPARLLGFVSHFSKVRIVPETVEKKSATDLQKLIILLRSRTGNDFSYYKKNTLMRRIDRRMNVHLINNISDYVKYAQKNPQEIDLLFKELLIGVTNFFRDLTAFELLETKVIRPILQNKPIRSTVRVWAPGCSSGEEAYSLAILFREGLEQMGDRDLKVQIYATDIDDEAISIARQGAYMANIAADVSAERLQRFFAKDEMIYRVKKEVREMVVFARQNIISDPPFTRLDLLCCRNLLIYLTPDTQQRLLTIFQYALLPDGFLFLGSSESVHGNNEFFSSLDAKWKIYCRRAASSTPAALPDFPSSPSPLLESMPATEPTSKAAPDLPEMVQQVIMETVAPPVLFINEKGDLIYTTQRTGKYLEPTVGKAVLNVFEMARQGLKLELSSAVRKALSQRKEVKITGLMVKTNGDYLRTNVTVRPVIEKNALQGLLMIIFEDQPPEEGLEAGKEMGKTEHSKGEFTELEKELQYTKENLQTTIEEMETSQEELKSTNEELQSANEELQSANEELSTSKEEFQSLNEELMTVNAELHMKNDEYSLANNDLRNLLNSTQIPTIFLDNKLNIKRYTNSSTAIFNLIPSDVGRPITDIAFQLQYDNLLSDVVGVIETLYYKEKQVQGKDGCWYNMRIMPYRTIENVIDGVVITLNDITRLLNAERKLKDMEGRRTEKEEYYRTLVEALPNLIWTCKPDGACDYLSPQWVDYTGIEEIDQLGLGWGKQLHPEDWPRVREAWLECVKNGAFFDSEYRIRRKDGAYRWFRARAIPIRDLSGRIVHWFGTCTDMDDMKTAQKAGRENEEFLHQMLADSPVILFNQDRDLRYTWVFNPHPDSVTMDLIGKTDAELFSAKDAALLTEFKLGVLESGIPTRQVISVSFAGKPSTLDFIVRPLRDPSGNITGVTCISVDITDRS